MARVNLDAKTRTQIGKQGAKQVRRTGNVPVNLYGHGMTPLSLQVGKKEFHETLHTKAGENVVINLRVEGLDLKESTCLIKDIQHNPVSDFIDHVDLMVISLTEKIDVKVPLVVLNAAEAVGLKEGGILDVIHHEIEVECLPTEIPEKVEVDAKPLKINDAVYAKDLVFPEGVTCKMDPDEVVLALHPPAKEETPAEETGVVEPEVIEKGKKPEAEEEKKEQK